MVSFICGIKKEKVKFIETESGKLVARGFVGVENRKRFVKGHKVISYMMNKF